MVNSPRVRKDNCLILNFRSEWASAPSKSIMQLLHLIETKRIDPTKLISHIMKLSEAPKADEIFDKKQDATKVVLTP